MRGAQGKEGEREEEEGDRRGRSWSGPPSSGQGSPAPPQLPALASVMLPTPPSPCGEEKVTDTASDLGSDRTPPSVLPQLLPGNACGPTPAEQAILPKAFARMSVAY